MKQIFIIFQDGAVSIDATESNLEIVNNFNGTQQQFIEELDEKHIEYALWERPVSRPRN